MAAADSVNVGAKTFEAGEESNRVA